MRFEWECALCIRCLTVSEDLKETTNEKDWGKHERNQLQIINNYILSQDKTEEVFIRKKRAKPY